LHISWKGIPISSDGRKIDKDDLKQTVAENPDAFLRELAEKYDWTESAVFYALKKLAITRKKRLLPITKNQKRNELNIKPR
jgi:putative heme iron utilization protein